MLPILRTIPVGGVLLAIAIVLLALNPPRATSRSAPGELMAARGPLINRNDHPEWRQFLILAALRRAGELRLLRNLHDTVVHHAPPAVATAPDPQAIADADVAAPGPDKAPPADAKPELKPAAKTVAVETVAPTPPKQASTEIASHETPAPMPIAATPATASAAPEVAQATPLAAAGPAPVETASKPVVEAPAVAKAEPAEVTPAAPALVEPIATAPIAATPARARPIAVAPVAVTPAPIAAKLADDARVASIAPITAPPVMPTPAPPAKSDMKSAKVPVMNPEAKPVAAAAPVPEKADPAATRETTGSRIGTDLPPSAPPTPKAAKVAALTTQRADPQSGDITGSIDQSPEHGTTIPLGIGEASSTEIEVFMPRERPPVLRELDLQRANQSRLEPRRRASHRRARAKRNKTATAQRQDNFFAFLFHPFGGPYEPIKFNPYQPPQYRSGEMLQ